MNNDFALGYSILPSVSRGRNVDLHARLRLGPFFDNCMRRYSWPVAFTLIESQIRRKGLPELSLRVWTTRSVDGSDNIATRYFPLGWVGW